MPLAAHIGNSRPSSVGPKRFFTARSIRNAVSASPSNDRPHPPDAPTYADLRSNHPCDMPHQKHWDIKGFGGVNQRARHFAHLRGSAGDAIDVLRDDGLRRIDDGQRRLELFDKPPTPWTDPWWRRVVDSAPWRRCATRACGPAPAIPRRKYTVRYCARWRTPSASPHCRRFPAAMSIADARLSCDQRDRSRHDATAEHAVEFRKSCGDSGDVLRAYVGDRPRRGRCDRMRLRARGPSRSRGTRACRGTGFMEFLNGAPLTAFGAAAEPLRAAPAAFGTEELRGRLCHIADNTEVLGQDVRGWRTRCTDIALKTVSGTGFHDFEGMVARLMAVKE